MYFSDTTNKDGIIQLIEQTLGYGDGYISGSTVNMAYFTNLVNKWLNITTHWIQQVDHQWSYDDDRYSNFPIYTYDLSDGVDNYALTDEKILRRVEARDAGSQNFYDLRLLNQSEIPEDRFGSDKGKVSFFWFNGNNIVFYPKPDITKSDQYRLTFDRSSKQFSVSDTDVEPGFERDFHHILVYGPAMDQGRLEGEASVYNTSYQALFGSDPVRDVGLKSMLQNYYFRRSNLLGGAEVSPQKENF